MPVDASDTHRPRWRASLVSLLAVLAFVALALPAVAGAKRNLYVSNYDTDNVSAFDISATGALTPVTGSPFATEGDLGVAASPDGRHLYVVGSAGVSAFDISATGALTPVTGSPFATGGSTPQEVSAGPGGTRLYVPNSGSDNVSVLSISATGALTPVAGSPFAAGDFPVAAAASPDGKHLYVVGNAGVSAFDISATGALTPVTGSPFAAGAGPTAVATSPNGEHLYVANYSGSVSVYRISASGALSEVTGSPFATGTGPQALTVSPDGKHLYVPNGNSDDISTYEIASSGAPSEVEGSPFATGSDPFGVAASPDGKHLYVPNYPGNVSAYDVSANGALAPVTGSPFATGGTGPDLQSVAITPNQPPVASFTRSPNPADLGTKVRLDASASTDPDGTVTTYDWDFGDGTTLPDGGSNPKHTYVRAGTYNATLTLTDNEGCSTTIVYTGQTTSCNGSAVAEQTKTVKVADVTAPKTKITKKPKAKVKTKKKKAKVKVSFTSEKGAKFKCKLDKAKFKPCTSTYKVKAKSKRGNGKKHTISVKATDDAGNVGKAATARFKVIRKG